MSKITLTCRDNPNVRMEALLFNAEGWQRINEHVLKAENRAKELAEEYRRKQEMKDGSDAMTKKWDNTYLNLRKKRLEERRLRIQREIDRKHDRFNKIVEEKKAFTEAKRKEANDRLYREQDDCKALLSAYKFAETLRERKLQQDFNCKLKKIEEDREKEYVKKVYDDVDKFNKEEEDAKAAYCAKKKQLGEAAAQMFHEAEKRKREEKERIENEEREDMAVLSREIQQIAENERKEKERKMELVRKDLIESRQMFEMQKKVGKSEEIEEDEALSIIANGKLRMSRIRKEKEAEMRAKAVETREKISGKVAAMLSKKQGREDEIYEAARAEKEALALKRIEDDINNKKRLRDERIAYHANFVKQEEIRKHNEHQLAKWHMLQRFKREEVDEQFWNLAKERKMQKIKETRHNNLLQAEENRLNREKEIELEREDFENGIKKWKEHDECLFKFAEELKAECNKVGRPTFPLDLAVCEYKKRCGLLEIPPVTITKKTSDQAKLVNPRKSPMHRKVYVKMDTAKNANRLDSRPQHAPIQYVKHIKHANGLQDQQKIRKF